MDAYYEGSVLVKSGINHPGNGILPLSFPHGGKNRLFHFSSFPGSGKVLNEYFRV